MSTAGAPSEDKYKTTLFQGRTYQTFSLERQVYLAPVDEEEEDRLRGQHEMLKMLFDNRRDPLLPDAVQNPRRILDCGFGTGDWATDLAEKYPDCEVIGMDISPIWVSQIDRPDNFYPEIGDMNLSESFGPDLTSFDFVHSRFVAGGIGYSRWPSYIMDIRRALRPGGSVLFTEWDPQFRSDIGNGDRLAALRQWSDVWLSAMTSASGWGKKGRMVPDELEAMLRASSFVNVSTEMLDVPVSDWSNVPKAREIGEQNLSNVEAFLTAAALYPVVGRGIMTPAAFQELIDRCIRELRNHASRIYIRLYSCYAERA